MAILICVVKEDWIGEGGGGKPTGRARVLVCVGQWLGDGCG